MKSYTSIPPTYNPIKKTAGLGLILCIVAIVLSGSDNTTETLNQLIENVSSRYPYRLPDWFWQSPLNAHLISPQEVIATRVNIARLDALSNSAAKQNLENDIAASLAAKFSLHDLIINAKIINSPKNDSSLALLIDPSFEPRINIMLQEAALLFMEVAFDPEVIKKAFNRSTQMPAPMPAAYDCLLYTSPSPRD